ncbi:MAG: GNAT family N-acetyltransferase, partial [Pseudomonadota bacterium]
MIQSPDSDPIRQAKSGDLEAVRSCVAAAYGRYEEKIGKPAGPVLANYDLLISQERVHVLAIQDEIVGVLVLVPQSEFMLMDNVAVHPDSQGKGLGSILIAYAEQCAVRSG